jgi:hypothetical protein
MLADVAVSWSYVLALTSQQPHGGRIPRTLASAAPTTLLRHFSITSGPSSTSKPAFVCVAAGRPIRDNCSLCAPDSHVAHCVVKHHPSRR